MIQEVALDGLTDHALFYRHDGRLKAFPFEGISKSSLRRLTRLLDQMVSSGRMVCHHNSLGFRFIAVGTEDD